MRPALRQASHHHEYTLIRSSVPVFLCPALARDPVVAPVPPRLRSSRKFTSFARQHQEVMAAAIDAPRDVPHRRAAPAPVMVYRDLPISCPGCGAPSQILDKGEAGYYNLERNAVKAYLGYDAEEAKKKAEELRLQQDTYTKALKEADPKILEEVGMEKNVLG